MKRSTWPLIAVAAIFALGIVSTLAITDHAEQRAVIRAQTATSAATSIILFLVVVILGMGLLAVGVVALSYWLRQRQKQARLEDALQQAQIYALLGGARPPAPRRRPPAPSMPAPSGNIIVLPGGGQQPAPAVGNFTGRQPTPLAGLLPPDDGEWEVL